jgi:hypothetical protein
VAAAACSAAGSSSSSSVWLHPNSSATCGTAT